MQVDLFDFDLPRQYIAEHPVFPRDSAKMLEVIGSDVRHRQVRDLIHLIQPDDIIVANDTKVIPARLYGYRNTSAIEITIHQQVSDERWLAFAKPARKLKIHDRIDFNHDFYAIVAEKRVGGEILLVFNCSGERFFRLLEQYGAVPLPPYIKRSGASHEDRLNYQTVFAKHEGAVAAPTASLHFTTGLLAELNRRCQGVVMLTLHVGAGTFLPVKVEDTNDHRMHSEWGHINRQTAEAVNQAHALNGRVIALGTTSLRLLETAADNWGKVHPFSGSTDLFITPGYRFKIVDLLLTNFHLPRSTLFMLTAAFAGLENMHSAYECAKNHNYRFYSYGDCCLLYRTALAEDIHKDHG